MAAETVKVEPADSEQDEEEDVYEVERIIDMRVEEGEVLYRVRWKNYCSDDDTWEPEAHLEDCREVLLAFKKAMADAKAKKEAEAKKSMKLLPMKSDVFDADSESDGDKDPPTDLPMKKKKKTKIQDEESPPKEKKKKKKKDKRIDDLRPVPAPETDDEEEETPPTPPSPPKEMKIELKKRLVESDEDEDTPVPTKKHKKEKGKEEGKHKKDKVEEKKKKKEKKEKKADSSDEEAAVRLDDYASDVPSEAQMEGATPTDAAANPTEKAQLDDKAKPKRGKWEVKLRGIKDLIHEKKNKKPDATLKDSSLLKLKSLTSRGKDEAALHSDSSDSSTLLKKTKSKGQESTSAAPKTPSSSTSSSSSVTAASSTKGKEDEVSKEEVLAQKDATGSTNLFEKFLLNCEAKDRAPRRQPTHPPTSEKSSTKATKLLGKTEKIPKSNRDSPAHKPDPRKTDKTKQSDVPRPGQSHGFSLDSDEREGEDSAAKQRPGEEPRERRERTEETQRPGWERRTSADDRRKRREDSEPKVFLTSDDSQETQDPPESAEKSEKGQTTLSLGMDLNLDWMTLDDFQKHLNGEDEILSGPPLSPSELRDAVKIGDYMSVKLALNSKEDYNLDQEACTIGETKSFEGERSLIEERSSSDALKLTSGLDSAQNEEVTPRVKGIVPQDLDGPKDGNIMPSCPDSTNNEQVTMRELEKIQKYGRDITDQKSEQEDKSSDDTESDLSSKISLNFDHSNVVKTAEGMMTSDADKSEQNDPANKQHSPEEEHGSSIERENMVVGQPDSTDHGLFESATKSIVKARSLHCRKTVEKKLPTRSSSRTSKKVVETTSVVHEKKESYKKHFCFYCKMAFAHLAKHLEKKHAEETDVCLALHFPKGSKVRQNLLDQIRNKGDYEHNCQVLKSGRGEIVTQKQMKTPRVSVRDFLPCQHCFAFYRKADLWRHERSCKVRKGDQKTSERTETSGVHSAASRLLPMAEFLTEGCKEIINIMHQDDISKLIRKDPLICKYGNALSVKYDHDKSQFAYIAQKMRELGRFVHAVNQLDNSVNYLHEVCQPSRFELAVEGAKKASGFDPSSSKFKTVSLVSKIGYSLKRAAEIAFGESRMTEDSVTESEVKMFIQLLDTKWSECFTRRSLALSLKQEVKKVEVDKSCVTEDLIKLHRFIIVEEDEGRRDLKESPSLSTWKKLSEATLADICLFNRGRVGNIGRMLLHTYTHKKSKGTFVPSADQIRKSTKLELELGSNFTSLELEGQYGRNMLVLLTERMVLSIDLLIENREQAGVSETNQYLFARTEGPSFIRGLDCFRRAAMESGVTNAEALLCPSLRERIASCWQLMSLSEYELDQVAVLLGWSSQDCYRLSENASQLEEVSQQLLKMDQTLPSSPHGTAKDGATQKSTLKRRPWSEKEQVAVKRYLCEYITEMKVPGKKECNACIAAEQDLCGRSWTDVKNYVHNTLQTIRRRNNQLQSEEIKSQSPKAGVQITTNDLEDGNTVHGMTTGHPDHLTEGSNCCMTMSPLGSLREASALFPQEMTPSYTSLCSTSTNMVLTSQPLVSTFTPLNATDTQVVPTFTPHNTTNALMPPAYTSENNMMLTLSPLYTQNATSMPPPSVYAQDTTSSPIIPNYSTFNAPSTSVMPTFTQLDTPSSPMVPAFSTLSNRSRAIISSFSPLNQPSMTAYPANPPMGPGTAQVVPTIHRSNVPDRTQVVQGRTATSTTGAQAVKPQKRVKRLWSEEEQAAVRRQFGDLCKLVKVPGKKDCDACLAAEPALNSRTWREVKYFVHNSIQSLKRKGHQVASKQSEGQEPETQNSNTEWDGPVYLSL